MLLAALLALLPASAQQEYFEAGITHADRNGKRVWLHDGKPLQGVCKINYLDIDFAARYTLADYRDGVRSDTVSYYSGYSDKLLRKVIRLGEQARHICDYDRYGDTYLREWTEAEGRIEGVLKEWDTEGNLRKTEEYRAGVLEGPSREWDKSGRLVQEEIYRNDRLDGKAKSWHYEGPSWGELEVSYHRSYDRPYLVERYSFFEEEQGLIERTVPDSDGNTLYTASKPDCDSMRIDTLCGARMIVEIRDFKEGTIRSLERFDAFTGVLIPHGIFERYAPDGRIGTRLHFEDGELLAVREYEEEEPREDVRTTLLSRADGDRLLAASSDSKHLAGCEDGTSLCIRDHTGDVLLSVAEEGRRYEYHGYDPQQKLHVGFSSVGDWNDVHWYVVYDAEGVQSFFDSEEDYLVVNGLNGMIATGKSHFEGELDLAVHRFFTDPEAGGYFETVFAFTLPELPGWIESIHWIGENSLAVVMEKSCIRLDIAPESLEGYNAELDCTD